MHQITPRSHAPSRMHFETCMHDNRTIFHLKKMTLLLCPLEIYFEIHKSAKKRRAQDTLERFSTSLHSSLTHLSVIILLASK
jgi:hypothetical protein